MPRHRFGLTGSENETREPNQTKPSRIPSIQFGSDPVIFNSLKKNQVGPNWSNSGSRVNQTAAHPYIKIRNGASTDT